LFEISTSFNFIFQASSTSLTWTGWRSLTIMSHGELFFLLLPVKDNLKMYRIHTPPPPCHLRPWFQIF